MQASFFLPCYTANKHLLSPLSVTSSPQLYISPVFLVLLPGLLPVAYFEAMPLFQNSFVPERIIKQTLLPNTHRTPKESYIWEVLSATRNTPFSLPVHTAV